MRRLLPLLLALVLAPPALAVSPLPGCTLPALPPDPNALEGNGYVRVGPGATASWAVNGARWGSWHGDRAAYWTEPLTFGAPSLLCVDGAPVATGKRAQNDTYGRVVWSADGTRVAYVADGVLTVRAGSAVTTYGLDVDDFAWSPSGNTLLVRDGNGSRLHFADGTTRHLGSLLLGAVWGGGRVFGYGDYVIVDDRFLYEYVSELPDGSDRRVHGVGRGTPSPDGTRVAFYDDAGFRVVGADGTDHGSVAVSRPDALSFSPDASVVAFQSGGVVHTWNGTTVTRRSTAGATAFYPAWAGSTLSWIESSGQGWSLVADGTLVATGAFSHGLELVRRDADGSFLVEVEKLRGLPTNG